MAKQPKPKTGGSSNDNRANKKAAKKNPGVVRGRKTIDPLGKGFETKFLNACRKADMMRRAS